MELLGKLLHCLKFLATCLHFIICIRCWWQQDLLLVPTTTHYYTNRTSLFSHETVWKHIILMMLRTYIYIITAFVSSQCIISVVATDIKADPSQKVPSSKLPSISSSTSATLPPSLPSLNKKKMIELNHDLIVAETGGVGGLGGGAGGGAVKKVILFHRLKPNPLSFLSWVSDSLCWLCVYLCIRFTARIDPYLTWGTTVASFLSFISSLALDYEPCQVTM